MGRVSSRELWASALCVLALTCSKQVGAQNSTSPSAATANATVTSYFQVPPFALYLCPYADGAAPTRAFGYNLATTPANRSAASSMGDRILAACPRAASSAGNFSGANTTQTISLPIGSSGSGNLRPETFYAVLVQRKAAIQQLTITLSISLDGGSDSVLFDHQVLTLYPTTARRRRRRSLLSAGDKQGEDCSDDDGNAAVLDLHAGARRLLKGSSGGGGGGSKGGGGSSGGSKSSGGGGSKSGGSKGGGGSSNSGSKSGGSSGKPVKVSGLVKGGTYASRAGVGVVHYGVFQRSNKYRIRSSKHHYKTPAAKALAYGMPALFAAWFFGIPLAVAYGYTGDSLFRSVDTFSYATPAVWPGWEAIPASEAAAYACPSTFTASSGSGLDCWQPGSSTCCGTSYSNTNFGVQTIPVGYTKRGAVLNCGLRNDVALSLPVFLPDDAKTVQLEVHSIEAKLGSSTCGTTNQTLDPTNPAVYVSLVQLETVATSAAGPCRTAAHVAWVAAALVVGMLLF